MILLFEEEKPTIEIKNEFDSFCCYEKDECKTKQCIRQTMYLSPNWFDGWLHGEPELAKLCKYFKPNPTMED